jgi:hypothetical protein
MTSSSGRLLVSWWIYVGSCSVLPSRFDHNCARITVFVLGCAEKYLIGHIFVLITPHIHSATLDFDRLDNSWLEKLGSMVSWCRNLVSRSDIKWTANRQ